MSVSKARQAALRVITRVRRDDAFTGPVLARELRTAALSASDAALATRIAYGTLATSGVLDEVIDRFARGGLEPRVRDCLRAGAYELLFSRAAAYAVVDQTVEAVRAVRPQAASLANAVMRRIAECASGFPFGDPAHDDAALARATGHPLWIVQLMVTSLGRDAARQALYADLEAAPGYVRLDPFVRPVEESVCQLVELGAQPSPAPPDPDCRVLGDPAAAYRDGSARGFFAMDAASQLAPAMVRPEPGMHIADVGAGRGNKTICLQALSVRAGGAATITAIEMSAHKGARLRDRLEASGVPSVIIETADARDLSVVPGHGSFDAVLVDAPCTGLGTLRRYPEKRWRLRPGDVARMADVQVAMLKSALNAVRPGGRVVYSTCSVASQENGEVVSRALADADGHGLVVESLSDEVPSEWGSFVTPDGCFQSWPSPGGPDGHYVARVRRVSDAVRT